jgi:hypothetical protein
MYDLVGAGELRLTKYKSKFNPALRRYYVVTSGGAKMAMAIQTYEALGSIKTKAPEAVASIL